MTSVMAAIAALRIVKIVMRVRLTIL